MGPSLEEILAFLALYGKPVLMKMTNGWYSSLEVLVSGAGVQFKITSETDHRTPKEAAQCCKDRLGTALHGPVHPAAPASDKEWLESKGWEAQPKDTLESKP